jgi:phosphatidylserine/phosphatidylglycerophosphate/cardiolipin synthase-like enzyme
MFADLHSEDMRYLAALLSQGKVAPPYGEAALQRADLSGGSTRADLDTLAKDAFTPNQIARLLISVAEERHRVERPQALVELVATGPDAQAQVRDTLVVVEQLFHEAVDTVLIVGFAIYDGQAIFSSLASRMDLEPNLKVTCCFDVARSSSDVSPSSQIVDRFARDFAKKVWPGKRLPEVYYDPRSLVAKRDNRAVLHAKTVVIDRYKAIVTSANPTPAAYLRNIEIGLVISGGDIPAQIDRHFRELIDGRHLERLNF